jgi:hypothetical protein
MGIASQVCVSEFSQARTCPLRASFDGSARSAPSLRRHCLRLSREAGATHTRSRPSVATPSTRRSESWIRTPRGRTRSRTRSSDGKPKRPRGNAPPNIAPEQLETLAKGAGQRAAGHGSDPGRPCRADRCQDVGRIERRPLGRRPLGESNAPTEISPTSCEKAAPNGHFRAATEYLMYYSV